MTKNCKLSIGLNGKNWDCNSITNTVMVNSLWLKHHLRFNNVSPFLAMTVHILFHNNGALLMQIPKDIALL